ncbi:unannotated protein [freshwater metagenome]|uniref:Unannotated protein n=1 Tax=freshwater metagenome TaxID=449393 RepID=A0A6J6MSR1_9ZZZZ
MGADVVNQLRHARSVGDITVMKMQVLARDVVVVVDVVNARSVEGR